MVVTIVNVRWYRGDAGLSYTPYIVAKRKPATEESIWSTAYHAGVHEYSEARGIQQSLSDDAGVLGYCCAHASRSLLTTDDRGTPWGCCARKRIAWPAPITGNLLTASIRNMCKANNPPEQMNGVHLGHTNSMSCFGISPAGGIPLEALKVIGRCCRLRTPRLLAVVRHIPSWGLFPGVMHGLTAPLTLHDQCWHPSAP